MKKILSITLGLVMILSMCSALMFSASAAADAQVLREYQRASNADILFYADFNSEAYRMNDIAKEKIDITPSADGREITVKAKEGSGSDNESYYGAYFEELEVNKGDKVTMFFQIKMNGAADGKETPTSNSVGVGCWFIDDYCAADKQTDWEFLNEYGNWNCDLPEGTMNRTSIRCGNTTKLADYQNNVEEATADADGFITIKIEYDYDERTITTFFLKDGAFVQNLTSSMMVTGVTNNVKKADHLGFGLYAPHVEVDATIKNFKIFKGLGLTPEQLAITENTTSEVEPTSATEKTYATRPTMAPTTTPTVDDTAEEGGCGGSLAFAAVAMIPAVAAVAVVANKKKED